MRRDVGFYIEADIQQVYQAYLMAAKNPPFERDCKEEPYHTIAFGVNFSFKYNMNGGSCNIHFMPCGTGTAVNIRFSIAQATGARYGKYAEDLNNAMRKYLPVAMRPAEYDMDDFLKPENQITPARIQPAAQPAPAPRVSQEPAAYIHYGNQQSIQPAPQPVQPAPVAPAPAPRGGTKFCASCGDALMPGARFCSSCGKPVSEKKVCPACNTPVRENAAFCVNCGTRL